MVAIICILTIYLLIGGGLGYVLAWDTDEDGTQHFDESDFLSIMVAWPIFFATGVISVRRGDVDDSDED